MPSVISSGRPSNLWSLAPAIVCTFALAMPALAFTDRDQNRIDDRIDLVNTTGLAAAYEDHDVTKRMTIGVFAGAPIEYAIYVGYDHHPTPTDATALHALGISIVHPYSAIDYIRSQANYLQIQSIARLPGVRRVEAIPMYYAFNHYGSRVVRARDSRGISEAQNYVLFPSTRAEIGLDGTGVVVGILDTGVNDEHDPVTSYPGHESVRGKFVGGGNFFAGNPLLNTAIDASENPNDHGGEASSYHATHVAGTAIGTGGPGGYFAGVAPGARLVDCKVLSDAGAGFGAADGIDWCIHHVHSAWPGVDSTRYRGVQVINMSLGCIGCTSNGTDADELMVDAATAAGITMCIATGNDGNEPGIASPAGAATCIAVGASSHNSTLVRTDDRVTDFSNEGPRDDNGDADKTDEMKPSVVAPGAGIVSADGDPSTDGTFYKVLNGTSMAAPHVAGCVALLKELNPNLTPLQIRTLLQNTAEHNILSVKGDRPNDPFGVDPNYDPGCGWGLVDTYAAAKEILNGTSGVQVTQVKRPVPNVGAGEIAVGWITQREFSFLGFDVYRAPDVGGAPGSFVKLTSSPIAPTGHSAIQGVSNRTSYLYTDHDPALTVGNTYWYRIAWVDPDAQSHLEPPVPVRFGEVPRVMTAYYSLTHNAVGNDLLIKLGTSRARDVEHPDFFIIGPPEALEDSSHVILPTPANTGTSTTGTVQHYWSVGFTEPEVAVEFRHPRQLQPWFFNAKEGGFVNRSGRLNSFSIFLNDSPGSASGTTYVTDTPTPKETVEGQNNTLWIPEMNPLAVTATMQAIGEAHAVRIVMDVAFDGGAAQATVCRSTSDVFESRVALNREPMLVPGPHFEYLDQSVEPGITYYYWIIWQKSDGGTVISGPVSGAAKGTGASLTFAAPAAPNPAAGRTVFRYAVGRDVAAGGSVEVSLTLHDLLGRTVKTLRDGRQKSGEYQALWDTTDDRGNPVSAGVYFLRFRAGRVVKETRVAVMR